MQVKFRRPKLIATMHRLDDELVRLDREIASGSAAAPGLVAQITAREKELLPLYSQIAVRFAELHDTSGRMKGKGVIRDIVAWPGSREYFYWRLRRKLEEFSITARPAPKARVLVSAARTLKRRRSIPGHAIAAVRALKSGLSGTAGGKGA